MRILERHILRIRDGRWDDMLALEKRWDALEARVGGFPAKRRYRPLFSELGLSTWVQEREWESLADMEAAYARLGAEPESRDMQAQHTELSENISGEVYMVLP